MKMIWTKKQIEIALNVKVPAGGAEAYGRVEFNSKEIKEGDLFIALPGARDGHEFVEDALKNGAAAAIVSQDIKNIPDHQLIKVEDTIEALSLLSEYKRRTTKAKIVAITGSVGKTSTKEITRLMLSAYGKVHANNGTFNNYLGVPLTLASMPDDIDYAVIEMGMSAKGELSYLSNQVLPDVAVITAVSEGHLEFFKSVEEIADAKCEIFEGLDLNDGVAIINRDSQMYYRCLQSIDAARLQNVQSFGKHKSADVRFVSYDVFDDHATRLLYEVGDESIEIVMDYLLPMHLAENFAAAFAVIKALRLDLEPAASAVRSFQMLLGRGRLVSLSKDGKSYNIICDYYNSNPQSLQASLEHFVQLSGDRKIAVLGDMGELGESKLELHQRMVPYIKDSGAKKLFLVGEVMGQIAKDLPKDIMVKCYKNVDALIAEIDQYIEGGEFILIKGSRFLKLENLAKHLGVEDVL
jgi:UDP-N-acetylmuramoyl-tripeptide--D-alanyl-D-alanine ligase